MAKTLLLHLSDLHIKTIAADWWTKQRAQSVARSAVRSGPFSRILIIITGDIAYGGASAEYAIAQVFLKHLTEELRASADCSVLLATCPGNHDCDFSSPSILRDMALNTRESDKAQHEELLAKLAEPLSNFKAFEREMDTYPFSEVSLLCKSGLLQDSEPAIQLRIFTSPLYSTLHENKGELFLPPAVFSSGWVESALRIAVLHHPPAWFDSTVDRSIRTALRSNAHILLYGHEHTPEITAIKTPRLDPSESILEIDGAVFNDSSDTSIFLTYQIGKASEPICAEKHTWDAASNCYRAVNLSEAERPGGWLSLPKIERGYPLNWQHRDRLQDPGIASGIGRDKPLTLADIYVHPELSGDARKPGQDALLLPAETLHDPHQLEALTILQGDERAGKTALLFTLFASFHEAGYTPLYISLREQPLGNARQFEKAVIAALRENYAKLDFDQFTQLEKASRILLLDDLDYITDPAIRTRILDYARASFGRSIFSVTLLPKFTEILTDTEDGRFGNLPTLSIDRMSSAMRLRLIRRWVENAEGISSGEEFLSRIDFLEKSANITLGTNLVPRVPQMLLIFLKSLSANTPTKLENGALANYYHFLVTQYLLDAGTNPDELDEPLSFGRIVAHAMSQNPQNYITKEQLQSANDIFDNAFFSGSLEKRIRILVQAKLLLPFGSDAYKWREPYIYYLFLAGYYHRNPDDPEVRAKIGDLLSHLYVRDNANTLLFLAHYTKDAGLFRELTSVINRLFSEEPPFVLGGDTKAFSDLIRTTGELIPSSDPVEERLKRNQIADRRHFRGDGLSDHRRPDGARTLVDEITMLFKTSEIVGQVLKEQYASMHRSTREPLVTSLMDAFMRAAGVMIHHLKNNKKLMQSWLERYLGISEKSTTIEERTKAARFYLAKMAEIFMFAFFQKLAESISSEKTIDLIKNIAWPTTLEPKVFMLACEMNMQRPIPFGLIDELISAAENDPAFSSLLRNLVQLRLMLFHTRASDLQALSSRFKLSVRQLTAKQFLQ